MQNFTQAVIYTLNGREIYYKNKTKGNVWKSMRDLY